MTLPEFQDLTVTSIRESLVFIDVDGTLLPDAEVEVRSGVRKKIEELRKENELVLLSNSFSKKRIEDVAQNLNLPYVSTRYLKPHPMALGSYAEDKRARVVIGDKLLTDGLFSFFVGATFLHVLPLRDRMREGILARMVYDVEHALRMMMQFGTIARFLVAGSSAALVLLLVLYLCTDVFGLWYLASSVVAFIFAFCTSFALHKFWTFQDHHLGRSAGQATGHLAVGLVNLALNTSVLYAFVEFLKVHYLLAQILTSGLLAVGSFFVYKHVIFRKGKAGAAPQATSFR